MSAQWKPDPTTTIPPSYTTTIESDEVIELDTTALLVVESPPSIPQSILYRVVDNGPDTVVTLADAPEVVGNAIRQRIRNLTARTTYKLRVSFLTNNNRRTMTLYIIIVE